METKKQPVKTQAAPVDDKPIPQAKNEPVPESTTMNKTIIIVYIVLLFLGVGTGYLLSRGSPGVNGRGEKIESETVVGIKDTQTFKDSAEGTIEKGGIDGEGTHQLVREGGSSQTVYLTSSVIDLDEFVGKKVVVWGQTMAAQKAGWLMDVGKVETK